MGRARCEEDEDPRAGKLENVLALDEEEDAELGALGLGALALEEPELDLDSSRPREEEGALDLERDFELEELGWALEGTGKAGREGRATGEGRDS